MSGQAIADRKPFTLACAALGTVLFMAGQAVAQPTGTPPPSSPATAPSTVTKGATAWQQLVGNTVVAQGRGGGYTEYYAADGSVTHLDQDGKSAGKWTIEGDKICFDFPEEDDRSCVDVESDGKTGTFTDEDKSRDTFTVLPGNAKSL